MNARLVVSGAVAFSFFAFYALPKAEDAQFGAEPARATGVELVDGHDVGWWSRRAIQNGENSRARGRTIRRLQHAQARASAHFFEWLAGADCVQGKEARWNYDGPTYDGGMQADASFQRTYAPDLLRRYGKPAWAWPWYAQLQMAYRGWLSRGWYPWPNTARECGLL